MNITTPTFRYAAALAGVVATAAGLNMGVLQLSNPESEPVTEQATAAPAPAATPSPRDPLRVVVDVPVVVPSTAVAAPAINGAAEPTQTTGSTSTASETTRAVTPPTTTTAPAPTPNPETTTAPAPKTTAATPTTKTSATETTSTTSITTTAAPGATEYLYYAFSGVASELIVAQHADGSLEFWSATTEPGWNYLVEKRSGDKVEVKFSRKPDGEGEAKWELEQEDGRLRVKEER